MNNMDNNVPSEGGNRLPPINFDELENQAYQWVSETFNIESLTKDQIVELVKMHMRKHVYQMQFQMVLEKYQGTVTQYEEIARRLDDIDALKGQASEGKDALINEQARVIRDLLTQKDEKNFVVHLN